MACSNQLRSSGESGIISLDIIGGSLSPGPRQGEARSGAASVRSQSSCVPGEGRGGAIFGGWGGVFHEEQIEEQGLNLSGS